MRPTTLFTTLLLALLLPSLSGFSQCADGQNIHTFTYNNKAYEVIKENKTWTEAAACAQSRGGYLAEINTAEEQQAVFAGVMNAGIAPPDTAEANGFGFYVWLGGNDITTEGLWALNGNNDDQAVFFWQGTATGSPLGNRYNNWGNEPDNWGEGTGQDALGMAIINFPNGEAGEWNDLGEANELFFVVEHNSLLDTGEIQPQKAITVSPNPSRGIMTLSHAHGHTEVVIYDTAGRQAQVLTDEEIALGRFTIEALPPGVYFLHIRSDEGETIITKIVRE